ncbi:P-type conjugative transfer protein TrbG [Rhizobium sp. EC-SD404]|uniref:P-type conjugative transfer protein TrbG n=1 Tax=Rhizobium sp. EC-SD404 TaxID=2038389 RepID=UPI00125A44A5|nr:P-type conjugative transfer protein TrbG [Rhizobium sp. EC-SD404]VVT24820.1 P-type conjugative transfer protein TrbG [Rhizobium sp. EC-SD404]
MTDSVCATLRISTLAVAVSLAGCATFKPPEIAYDDPVAAALIADPPRPVEIVERPEPLPLPGQLMRVDADDRPPEAADPADRIDAANAAARMEPVRDGFINAVQLYPYSAGALYQVYTSPGQITDIALQPGESLAGSGPIAAGDTARWIIGDTESGSGNTRRIHILVKPTRPDLTTNLVINTDRRTYHLELRATPSAYMASVSWTYAEDALIALRRRNAEAEATLPISREVALEDLNFRYRIEGDRPPWRPVRAFDDGRQVFIEFPRGIGQGEMPPLFVIGPEGEGQLVNYRIRRNYMVVDRLFAAAELRLGDRQRVVRMVRTDGVRALRNATRQSSRPGGRTATGERHERSGQ